VNGSACRLMGPAKACTRAAGFQGSAFAIAAQTGIKSANILHHSEDRDGCLLRWAKRRLVRDRCVEAWRIARGRGGRLSRGVLSLGDTEAGLVSGGDVFTRDNRDASLAQVAE
jgi:hypothetical protein